MGELPARLSHVDETGAVRMVDTSAKSPTLRTAVAEALVELGEEVADLLFEGALPKGDALAVARIAAIQGAKRTPELVPLCHPIALTGVAVDVERVAEGARILVTVTTTDRTGVEMEAMTGAALGAVTLYDMVKSVDKGIEIVGVRLLEKTGGKSGEWRR